MASLALILAIVAVGLLVGIGWGTRRILRDVGFMADIVERNIAETESQAPLQPQIESLADSQDTKPIGFGCRLHEGS
jgi:hypothetical protein